MTTTSLSVLFADDTNIFLSRKNLQSMSMTLNEQLTAIYEWLCCNKLSSTVLKLQSTQQNITECTLLDDRLFPPRLLSHPLPSHGHLLIVNFLQGHLCTELTPQLNGTHILHNMPPWNMVQPKKGRTWKLVSNVTKLTSSIYKTFQYCFPITLKYKLHTIMLVITRQHIDF